MAFCILSLGSVSVNAQTLSLHDAVQSALSSPQAQIADAQTEEARGQLRQAGLGPNPRLFLQSEDWRPWGDNFDFGSQTENYAFLSQTLETDGKRRKRVALARARLTQAEADRQTARIALTGRVATAYFNAVVLQRVAALLGQDIQAVNEIVQYDEHRVDEGAMRGVDLLRTRIERDRLLLVQRAAQREAAQAQLELLKQIGRTPVQTALQLTDTLESLQPVQPTAVDQILATRPDLQSLRAAVTAAEADLALQRSNRIPNLDLVGGYKRNNNLNTGYSALQLDLPFRNRNQGEIERAIAAVEYAKSSLAAAEARVRLEVAQSEDGYKRERDIVQNLLPQMRADAQENLRLLTEAYRMGGVDLLRFLDAERTAFDVEVSALRTLAEFRQSTLRLQLSYGVQP